MGVLEAENASLTSTGKDPSRMAAQPVANTYNIDTAAAEIQRGNIASPGFFGNVASTGAFKLFSDAASLASEFYGASQLLREDTVEERSLTSREFHLTEKELRELQRRAVSIAVNSNIPLDVVEDFLLILCNINRMEDMKVIADGVQIPELYDASILRVPMAILAVPGLEKIAFAASAVEGLVNMYKRYATTSQFTPSFAGEDDSNIMDTLSSVVSGFGAVDSIMDRLAMGSAESALGHFMSELITGARVPMTVIAKNPVLQIPSYIGKVFFGESATALSAVDMAQVFAKKIAAFPLPSNGAGASSFGLQNLKSLAGDISLSSLVSKIGFGSTVVAEGTKKARQIAGVVDQISSITGALGSEKLDIRRADTAIPMLSALSAVASGTEKALFSTDTFSNGWTLSNGVSAFLQAKNSKTYQALRTFL